MDHYLFLLLQDYEKLSESYIFATNWMSDLQYVLIKVMGTVAICSHWGIEIPSSYKSK